MLAERIESSDSYRTSACYASRKVTRGDRGELRGYPKFAEELPLEQTAQLWLFGPYFGRVMTKVGEDRPTLVDLGKHLADLAEAWPTFAQLVQIWPTPTKN